MIGAHKVLATAAALVIGVAMAPALYAQGSGSAQEPHDSMMGPGMGDNMMNMMGGMSQTQDMMDHCSQMMNGGGSGKPNEQWRQNAPAAPDDQD